MLRKSPALSNRIAAEIAARGPISFARFMEVALYDPDFGYYATNASRIGRRGDFFTNVSVGAVFGRVLAEQFVEMAQRLEGSTPFRIVEQGAGDGTLASDVLAALPAELSAEYWIVEPLGALREAQEKTLADCQRTIRWFESVDALPQFSGVHFSNELVDALPFHLVRSTGEGWDELRVAGGEGGFVFVPSRPGDEIQSVLGRLPMRPAGYTTEVRPAAEIWLTEVASRLEKGFILLADYGFSRDRLYAPQRTEGTFSCYRAHRRDADPLAEPGCKDITAHVDFTALREAAELVGLRVEGFTDQHHFLVGAAQGCLRALSGPPDAARQKSLRALQTLFHPETMGTQFHYLAFSRNVSSSHPLAGFQFARDHEGRKAVGFP